MTLLHALWEFSLCFSGLFKPLNKPSVPYLVFRGQATGSGNDDPQFDIESIVFGRRIIGNHGFVDSLQATGPMPG